VRLDRFLPQRVRALAPEAFAFAVIGLANTVLYYLVFNGLLVIGAVKATIVAAVVTTYLAYLANRHWTYKNRPRSALRREYTLFFGINLVGLCIQAVGTGVLKYGFQLSEAHDRLAFNIATTACVAVATAFRFWTYRTFVFMDAPAATATIDPVDTELLALTSEVEFEQLTARLEAELSDGNQPAADAARTH
jgi:putative flippase GtrA